MRNTVMAAAFGAGLALASGTAANATIVFAEGNPGGFGGGNVLFTNDPPDGTTIQGVLNQTPYNVTFTGTETLTTPAQGQARIEAASGGLNSIEYTLGAGLGFDRTLFNVNTSNTFQGGTLTITAFDQFGGSFTFTDQLNTNGQNFINLTTLDDQLITRVVLSSTADFLALQQVRIGDAQSIGGAVPEPATWAMMLLGFAGLAFAYGRKQTSGSAFNAV